MYVSEYAYSCMCPEECIGSPGNQTWILYNSTVLAWFLLLWWLPWPKATWGELIWLNHPHHHSSFSEVKERTQTGEAGKWQEKWCVLLPCLLQQAPYAFLSRICFLTKVIAFLLFLLLSVCLSWFLYKSSELSSLWNCEANLDCQLDLISNKLRDMPLAGWKRARERGLGGPGRDWEGICQKYFLRTDPPPEWGCPI